MNLGVGIVEHCLSIDYRLVVDLLKYRSRVLLNFVLFHSIRILVMEHFVDKSFLRRCLLYLQGSGRSHKDNGRLV